MKRDWEGDENGPPSKRPNAWSRPLNLQPEMEEEKVERVPAGMIDGSTRWRPPETIMREMKDSLMNKGIENFRSMSLEDMHEYLFTQICSGEEVDKEVFTRKLETRDKDYINMLSRRFEIYIDKLGDHVLVNGVDTIVCPSDSYKYCRDNKKCMPIPGYYENERTKYFSPQLYHILQDYGFFWNYLGIDTIKEQLPVKTLESQYTAKISYHLGARAEQIGSDRISILRDMERRLLRVQLMRSFNVQCCVKKEEDQAHIIFGNVLDSILKLTRDEMNIVVR